MRLHAVPVLLLALSHAHAGEAWPEVPDPPRSHVEWVARDAKVNGLPSRIEHFDSELSAAEVLDFYRARWARSQAGAPRELPWGREGRTLATLQGPFQLVLQVKPRKPQGSEGLLSVSNFREAERDFIPADWPRWSDTRVLQVMESVDGPRRNRMVAMVSEQGFEANQRRWREEWQRRGYALSLQHEQPPAGGERTWLAVFDRPPQSLEMTMAWRPAERRTYISANLVGPAQEASR